MGFPKSTLLQIPVLVLLTSLAPERSAASAAGQSPRLEAPAELKLSPYQGPLRTLQVEVGGVESRFLFDTGGGATVLTTGLAKAAGCTTFGRGTGFRHDGSRVDGLRGTPLDLAIGPVVRRGEVGVLDLDAFLVGLPAVGGIASLETFAGRSITVDLARDRLLLESEASLAERAKGARELRIRVAHQAGGASLDVFVAIAGRHGPLWFELDSGNVAPVLVAPHAFEELGLGVPQAGATPEVELSLVGFGPVKCRIASKEMIYDGLLNAEFFLRHVVTLDLGAGRAWLRANP